MVEVVEEGLAKKLAKGASELKFLLTQHKVAADIQGELYENGIDTVARFAAAATDEADLKAMLKDSFSINPSFGVTKASRSGCRRCCCLENRYLPRGAAGRSRGYERSSRPR